MSRPAPCHAFLGPPTTGLPAPLFTPFSREDLQKFVGGPMVAHAHTAAAVNAFEQDEIYIAVLGMSFEIMA